MCKKAFFSFLVFLFAQVCFSQAQETVQTKSDQILSQIKAADIKTAEKNVAALQRDFAGSPQLTGNLITIAWAYAERPECFEQAKDIFSFVAKDFPNSSQAAESRVYSFVMDTRLKLRDGDTAKVEAVIVKMRAENLSNPTLPKGLCTVAWAYAEKPECFEQAKYLFDSVVKDFPSSYEATEARIYSIMMSVKLKLRSGDIAEAEAVVAKMRAEKLSNYALPNSLYNIAWAYAERSEWFERAKDLFKSVAKDFPDFYQAADAGLYGVMMDARIKLRDGDIAGAESVVAGMRAGNSSNPALPNALYTIAWAYTDKPECFDKAKDLFKSVGKDFPDFIHSAGARLYGKVLEDLALIASQDNARSKKSLDKLISNLNESPYLADAIDLIMGWYQKKISAVEMPVNEDYRSPIEVWEKMTEKLPNLQFRYPDPYLFAAYYYGQTGEHNKAIQCYNKVLNKWPNYEYAWNVQYLVGSTYQEMKHAGLISEADADTATRQAYEQLIAKYPGSQTAQIANRWLKGNKK